MISRKITITNKLGLHARAAAKLVGTASHFESSILLEKSAAQVNGKSIMGVMMLAASKGSIITITVEGDDEDDAIHALCKLINDRFGEAE